MLCYRKWLLTINKDLISNFKSINNIFKQSNFLQASKFISVKLTVNFFKDITNSTKISTNRTKFALNVFCRSLNTVLLVYKTFISLIFKLYWCKSYNF